MKIIKWILVLPFLVYNLYAIDLANTSFIDFIRFVSTATNKNFIIDEEINKNISIIIPRNFDTKDSFKILNSVLYKHDMYLQLIGSTYYIKKLNHLKSFYTYKLVFLLPDKIIPILKKYYPKINISKSKKTIIFYSTYKDSKQIKTLISLLDKPTRSKKIRVSLISYKDSDILEYGLNFNLKYNTSRNDFQYKTFLNSLVSSSSLFLKFSNFSVTNFISDLKTHNLIKSKFEPVLTLFDNKITDFSITQKIPYLNGQSSINGSNDIENNTYSYNDVGSLVHIDKVSITDNQVYFHILMKYEIILDKTITPTTSKRSIDNYLKLDDNQTILIAGIKSNELKKLHSEIPFLSSIPFFGQFFKWDSDSHINETFAIIITSISDADTSALIGGAPAIAGDR